MYAKRKLFLIMLVFLILTGGVYAAYAWNPVPVVDDPLVRMPGTQPEQVTLQDPTRCLNCHAGYDSAVEPGFAPPWISPMMSCLRSRSGLGGRSEPPERSSQSSREKR